MGEEEAYATLIEVQKALGFIGGTKYCPYCLALFWADEATHHDDCTRDKGGTEVRRDGTD